MVRKFLKNKIEEIESKEVEKMKKELCSVPK